MREFHTHDFHRNPPPDREEIPGPHIHFPSLNYPLREGESSWAYPIDAWVEDAVDGLRVLCDEVGIEIETVQLEMMRPVL